MAGGKGKITGKDGKPFVKNDERINRNGRPLKLPDLDELLKEVLGEKLQSKEALKAILIALRKKAMAGDVRACELLLDRAYGKLKVTQEHSGSIALPITGIQIILDDSKTEIAAETSTGG